MGYKTAFSELRARGAAFVLLGAAGLGIGAPRAYADGGPGDKPAASAPAKQAPTVSEQNVRKLFEDATLYVADLMSDNLRNYGLKEIGTTHKDVFNFQGSLAEWKAEFPDMVRGFDNADKFLLDRYKDKATTEAEKTAIVSFKAFGGMELAKEAAVELFGAFHAVPGFYDDKPTSILDNVTPWPVKTLYQYHIDEFKERTQRWENNTYNYNGKGMTFVAAITQDANETLDAAYNKHGMDFETYMTQVFIPFKGNDNERLSIETKKAAKFFGIGAVATPAKAISMRQP